MAKLVLHDVRIEWDAHLPRLLKRNGVPAHDLLGHHQQVSTTQQRMETASTTLLATTRAHMSSRSWIAIHRPAGMVELKCAALVEYLAQHRATSLDA
jgi:hypothetical protein